MNAPTFSVIICSIDPWKFAQTSQCYESLLAGFPHEIIGIHDARSLAEGYNRGLAQSSGQLLIFSHDDILILDPEFGPKIHQRLQNFDLLGFSGTSRLVNGRWYSAGDDWIHGVVAHQHRGGINLSLYGVSPWPVVDNIQAIDGLCMMARRQVALETGFDALTFDAFHLYDLDFSYSAWRAGKKLGVCCDIPLIHASTGAYDAKHKQYADRFVAKHAAALAANAGCPTVRQPDGAGGYFSSHHALLAAWQPDILQRAALAHQRFKTLLGSATSEQADTER
ncbi:hypothetical protein AGMMS49960_00780 [Betaproteobacteria bacterium]|nr:hypothetical protein AGMMS49543_06880 [Betaproteobacteria bacterium]GHT98188.1 hypothetical protein AGMMS49960_00780 [Betaproteobacteria bacterium]GHU21188.1 hypothetical protein AGMMS50243_18220 [Betaproteobacteria bacterium]